MQVFCSPFDNKNVRVGLLSSVTHSFIKREQELENLVENKPENLTKNRTCYVLALVDLWFLT